VGRALAAARWGNAQAVTGAASALAEAPPARVTPASRRGVRSLASCAPGPRPSPWPAPGRSLVPGVDSMIMIPPAAATDLELPGPPVHKLLLKNRVAAAAAAAAPAATEIKH
jgi:hypothetical protein